MLLRASLRALHIGAAAGVRARAGAAPTLALATAMGRKSHYAVAVGRKTGLFSSWDECRQHVQGYPGSTFKGFGSEQEARAYLAQHGVATPPPLAGSGAAPAPPPAAAGGADGSGAAAAAAAAAAEAEPPRKRRAPGSSSKKQSSAAAAAAAATGIRSGVAARPTSAAKGPVFRLEFDGASKQNPGPAGFGAVLYDDALGEEVHRLCRYMGDKCTNNQAEYAGLIAGLAAALELGCRQVKVQGDSTLIVQQVLGNWQVKNEGLRPYHAAAVALARQFAGFEARQVPRAQNAVADALSNQAIDEFRSGVNRAVWSLADVAAAAGAAAGGAHAAGDGATAAVAQGVDEEDEGEAAAAAAAESAEEPETKRARLL